MKLRMRAMQAALFAVFAIISLQAQRDHAMKSPDQTIPGVYQRWLEEDVLWIITPEERSAFLRFSKDDQRDHFIEQFWWHRNPLPAAPENAFKEEHYRRLAYANTHFAATVAGYRTDRGRIYILYGPPDVMRTESPHVGEAFVKPTVFWHYRSIPEYGKDVDLKFVDECRCGKYRLESLPKN